MSIPELDPSELVDTLEPLTRPTAKSAIAFDADGTLWTTDVGEIVFEHAVERGLIREEALPRLREEALAFGVPDDLGPSATAHALFVLYREHVYPEKRVCEMMVWCYAGMTEETLIALTDEALEQANFTTTINEDVLPLLAWARERAHRAIVVSASPTLIVRQAARLLGFSPDEVVGGSAWTEGSFIMPAMFEPLPYGPGKADAGSRALGDVHWLASLGDSPFDVDMMRKAELAVGVRPKPELERMLRELPHAVVLRGAGQGLERIARPDGIL